MPRNKHTARQYRRKQHQRQDVVMQKRIPDLIKKWDAPCLKEPCAPVDSSAPETLHDIGTMKLVLDACPGGVGLAAPQLGIMKNIVLIKPYRKLPALVMVNPEITDRGPNLATQREGCLSYPGVFAEVERHTRITVAWDHPDGWQERVFAGWEARIVQHELDHLEGICRVGDAWKSQKAVPNG